MFKKKIIYGCESRGDGQSPYLTRWTLPSLPWGALYLHRFHRSDADDLHDHPWHFWILILWRGYIEETPCPNCVRSDGRRCWVKNGCSLCEDRGRLRKRVWPGMILRRPAIWRHRVELVDGKTAVTLIWRGRYVREWGFWVKGTWQRWKEYFLERGC